MKSDMEVLSLFPTPVGIIVLKENLNKYKDYFSKEKFLEISNKSFVSENKRILEKYPKLKTIILNHFKNFVKETYNIIDQEFMITTSWITKIPKGAFSSLHNHKNSYYSGLIYYDEYDIDTGKLHFVSNKENNSSFMMIPKKKTINNSNDFEITPLKNGLVFFPSHLLHYISQHNNRNTRESLAFNIVPTGSYGSEDSTYDTSWFN